MSTWSIDDETSWAGASWSQSMRMAEEDYKRWAEPSQANQKEYDRELKRLNAEQAPDYDPWTDSYY